MGGDYAPTRSGDDAPLLLGHVPLLHVCREKSLALQVAATLPRQCSGELHAPKRLLVNHQAARRYTATRCRSVALPPPSDAPACEWQRAVGGRSCGSRREAASHGFRCPQVRGTPAQGAFVGVRQRDNQGVDAAEDARLTSGADASFNATEKGDAASALPFFFRGVRFTR